MRRALQLEQFPDEVELIPVADAADAQAKRFIGSPTIRIDGGYTAGWPSVDQIRQALQRDQRA